VARLRAHQDLRLTQVPNQGSDQGSPRARLDAKSVTLFGVSVRIRTNEEVVDGVD